MEILRTVGPAVLAFLTVWAIDWATRRRGLDPPGFEVGPGRYVRRAVAMGMLWIVLWLGIFMPLGSIGQAQEIDLSALTIPELFLLHGLLIFCVAVWYIAGYVGVSGRQPQADDSWQAQLGFRAHSIWREIGLGLVSGVGAWLAVLSTLVAIGLVIWWLGGEDLLPKQPPDLIPWIAGLPIAVKLLVSLSAGVVEETFFRGFLQPRVGIWFSSVLFVVAHASYEQPLMLVGITILSLIYGLLARWRQTIWPAIAAHFLFDATQLLIVIPTALDLLPEEGEGVLIPVANWHFVGFLGLG